MQSENYNNRKFEIQLFLESNAEFWNGVQELVN